MDRVATDLFVGPIEDAGDPDALRDRGIDRIVSLTHAAPDGPIPEGIAVVDVPLRDGPRHDPEAFREAVRAVITGRDAAERVLVHCSAGASRSPAVVATVMAIRDGIPLETAFERIAEARPAIDPHPALVRRAVAVRDQGQDRSQ
ncbi:dual specificity protein phosphatase [Halopenitus sp. POP-27]|uniref:dual specificity protein phosphatase family protein n=1 Tax=Halopenitus sp. POP-27 TaxID=2994425 RepID=UPI0024699989|nr:dual specificity protein phosphatase [Halopenitus sp. POP-27]